MSTVSRPLETFKAFVIILFLHCGAVRIRRNIPRHFTGFHLRPFVAIFSEIFFDAARATKVLVYGLTVAQLSK